MRMSLLKMTHQGTAESDTATNTQADPPWAAPDRERSLVSAIALLLQHALVVPPSRLSTVGDRAFPRGCGASVEQSAGFRHGVNVAAHVQATPEDCTVREKLLNTGCLRRLEHLPSHVIFCV